jgi:hypothetical protein
MVFDYNISLRAFDNYPLLFCGSVPLILIPTSLQIQQPPVQPVDCYKIQFATSIIGNLSMY